MRFPSSNVSSSSSSSFSLSLLLQWLLIQVLLFHPNTAAAAATVEDDLIDNALLESFLVTKSERNLNAFVQYSGYLNGTNPQLGCCGCTTVRDTTGGNDDDDDDDHRSHAAATEICQLHYWFIVEKHTDNDDDGVVDKPIIVWFNGGPGASSILGLLQEVGPFLMATPVTKVDENHDDTTTHHSNNSTKDGTTTPKLIINPYRWTKMAHLLVIENPVGVGYSYCHHNNNNTTTANASTSKHSSSSSSSPLPPKQQQQVPCYNTDNTTAQMTLYALVDFYTHKLPGMTTIHHSSTTTTSTSRSTTSSSRIRNSLYLMGESYAGVYIPTLANDILEYNNNKYNNPPEQQQQQTNGTTIIPLRGIAVGDPCTDSTAQLPFMDPLWYAHQYGLVDDAIYTTIRDDPMCEQYYQTQQELQRQYDDATESNGNHAPPSMPINNNNNDPAALLVSDECRLAHRKYLFSSSRGISATKHWNLSYVDRYALYGLVTNDLQHQTEAFMNHPLVRTALHIPEFVYQTDRSSYWKVHSTSDTMIYTKQYNACQRQPSQNDVSPLSSTTSSSAASFSTSMIDVYRIILPQLPSGVLIYNGNTDPAISYEGTRTAVKAIGYPEIDGGSYRPWFYNHTATSLSFLQSKSILFGTEHLVSHDGVGIQLGGYVTNYGVAPLCPLRNGTRGGQQLSFVTIHGSGHLVPQNRPQSSYHMISKFIQSHAAIDKSSNTRAKNHVNPSFQRVGCFLPLSPLLPSNASLLAIQNDTELLLQTLTNWTLLAKSSDYVTLNI